MELLIAVLCPDSGAVLSCDPPGSRAVSFCALPSSGAIHLFSTWLCTMQLFLAMI